MNKEKLITSCFVGLSSGVLLFMLKDLKDLILILIGMVLAYMFSEWYKTIKIF